MKPTNASEYFLTIRISQEAKQKRLRLLRASKTTTSFLNTNIDTTLVAAVFGRDLPIRRSTKAIALGTVAPFRRKPINWSKNTETTAVAVNRNATQNFGALASEAQRHVTLC